jgi:predicted lipoprotein with Yx(FWY)xxD motif
MRINNTILTALSFFILAGFDSCSKGSNSYYGSGSGPTPSPAAPAASFQIRSDNHFGSVLIDASGNTLYLYSMDAGAGSACTGSCVLSWPPSYQAHPTLGSGLDSSDFGSITRSDGTLQTTYKGWPLYRYQGDQAVGDINGDGYDGIWFVAKPDYSVMLVSAQLVGYDRNNYDSAYKLGNGMTQYMVDDYGVTLYSYSMDKAATNTYTLPDFSNNSLWPIVQVSGIGSVPSTLVKSAFSICSVYGKTQMTYEGWPVYRFEYDNMQRGSNQGISVTSPGTWRVMDGYTAAAP